MAPGYGSFDARRQAKAAVRDGAGAPAEPLQQEPRDSSTDQTAPLSSASAASSAFSSWFLSMRLWYQRLVFENTLYLFGIVQKRPLTVEDVQPIHEDDYHHTGGKVSSARLCQLYYTTCHRSLLRATWRMEWKGFVLSGLLMLLSIPCVLGPVVLLYVMLTSLVWQHNHPILVFVCFGAIALSSLMTTLLRNHALLLTLRIAHGIAAACKSVVLQSTLANARGNKSGIAEMTALNGSVDGLASWMSQLHRGWVALLELAGQVYILNQIVKAPLLVVIAGVGTMVMTMVVSARMEGWFERAYGEDVAARWKALNECFRGVQSMKLNGWEEKFEHRINSARDTEQNSLARLQRADVIRRVVLRFSDEMLAAVVFIVLALGGQTFDSAVAFPVIVLTTQIKESIAHSLVAFLILRRGWDGVKSIQRHLDRIAKIDEKSAQVVRISSGKHAETTVVSVDSAFLSHNPGTAGYALMNVSFCVNRCELVVVHGKAGEGKTTLLTALLGEVMCMTGEVFVSGECRVAYCSQEPWMQSITIRENILFGSPYDEKKYCAVLDACCLIEDLSVLPNGDRTVIGPRGINLSGGQKARIALARACYADADLYVLDCPLASVDAVVQMDVFRKCIVELLRYKTVLLATHNAEFIHSEMVDRLLEVRGKTVVEHGWDDWSEPISRRVKAYESSFWGLHRGNRQNKSRKDVNSSPSRCLVLGEITSRMQTRLHAMEEKAKTEPPKVSFEDQPIGSWDTLKQYFSKSDHTRVLLVIGCMCIGSYQMLLISKNLWLAWWSSGGGSAPVHDAVMYSALVFGAFCALMVAMFLFSTSISCASNRVFRNMLHAVLHAKFSFFYWIPTGEILNRFIMDVQLIDRRMMWAVSLLFAASSGLVGALLILWMLLGGIGIALMLFSLVFILKTHVIDVFVFIQRMEMRNESADFTIMSEALEGMSVIRAFGSSAVERFVSLHGHCVDSTNHLVIASSTVNSYELLCLSRLHGLLMMALATLLIFGGSGTLSAGQLGLVMVYVLNLPSEASDFVTGWYNVIILSISTNRLLSFSRIEQEVNSVIEGIEPQDTKGWVSHGAIVFDRVWFRYSENATASSYALKNVSFSIDGGSKIGVVGRTGSGKSSIAMALFRVHELVRGHIRVDGTDIRCLRLPTLRSKLCIIPQSPMFYRCTVREYLDPFDELDDHELWRVVHKTQLSSFLPSLQTELHENAENWSLGQRQLLCLARAMLRPSKIVILDEPFSSIDGESDKQLLSVLSSELRESTVLFVTHRVDQVLTFCEKILVLKDGEVEDFGVVEELVGRSDGVFFELLENTLLTM